MVFLERKKKSLFLSCRRCRFAVKFSDFVDAGKTCTNFWLKFSDLFQSNKPSICIFWRKKNQRILIKMSNFFRSAIIISLAKIPALWDSLWCLSFFIRFPLSKFVSKYFFFVSSSVFCEFFSAAKSNLLNGKEKREKKTIRVKYKTFVLFAVIVWF